MDFVFDRVPQMFYLDALKKIGDGGPAESARVL